MWIYRLTRHHVSVLLIAMIPPILPPAQAQDELARKPVVSAEAEMALASIQAPKGLKLSVFAGEPMLANPVAFCVDQHNRFYVAETFRHHAGVTDNRRHMNWLDDDLANRTVEDRVAMYRKWLSPDEFASYGVEEDRVRWIEDTDGDGRADRSGVFADGFNSVAAGIGAGVLAHNGKVYYTCIPDLWLLRDDNGVGQAEEKTVLHSGYGVHVAFLGHDLHGLSLGPDGRLYFTIGDRGLNVLAGERRVELPDTGAVLRCDLDGSNLELFATGLRNPQELAWDEFGNLFTVDNNSDGGDQARLVHLVPGGDSGWRVGYQYLEKPTSRGPWNAEKLWLPRWEGQAAYLLPPLANLSDGPSGLCYDPGTGLTESYRRHFFLCDFRGAPGISGIRAFTLRPRGASFELAAQDKFLWGLQATDVDFGTDGALYVTDWVQGWDRTGKGRIYRLSTPEPNADPRAPEVRRLLAEGFAHRSETELSELLAHPDARVRQGAQFALADQGPAAISTLVRVCRRVPDRLARLHAVWALGQIGRKTPKALEPLPGLLSDRDAEVRAQAARVLGEARLASAFPLIVETLRDPSPRVRFEGAMALGRLARRDAVAPILEMIRENADQDVYLRHAGVMALTWSGNVDALTDAAADPAPAVRLASLLALRRMESPEVSRFLQDSEPLLALEAARAIYDTPIPPALPALGSLISRAEMPEAFARRVILAQARFGRADNAQALARYVIREDVPKPLRVEALEQLAQWPEPIGRDPIMGLWRPAPSRSPGDAASALRPIFKTLLTTAPDSIRQVAAWAAGRLKLTESGPVLLGLVANVDSSERVRLAALQALEALSSPELGEAARVATASDQPRLRAQGIRMIALSDPALALRTLEGVLAEGTTAERQAAFEVLADLPGTETDTVLSRWMDRLIQGDLEPALHLDLLEAVAKRSSPRLQGLRERYESSLPKDDPLAAYRPALFGGNPARGRNVFLQKAEVSCLRCHKIRGNGGEVGPDLTGIGAKRDRVYLLESIVVPNKAIAEGFETLTIATNDGRVLSGVFKEETPETMRLISAEGQRIDIPKDQIEQRARGPSAMPEDLVSKLSLSELRDLVEYLARPRPPFQGDGDSR